MSESTQVAQVLKWHTAHGMWFAQLIHAGIAGQEFDQPEPRLEDYTSEAYDAAAHAAAYPGF